MAYIDTSNLTPDLDVALLKEGNSPHPWFDRAIMEIDGFIMPAVEDRNVTTPVGLTPTAGEMWLLVGVASSETLWEDQTDKLCLYYPSFDVDLPVDVDIRDEWLFMPIKNGMYLWVKDEDLLITRKSGSWFSHADITNPTTTLSTQVTALNLILDALQGHGFLDT